MLLSLAALALVQQAVAQTDMTALVIEEKLEALKAKECPFVKKVVVVGKAKDGSGKKTKNVINSGKDGSTKNVINSGKDGSGTKTKDGLGKPPKKTLAM